MGMLSVLNNIREKLDELENSRAFAFADYSDLGNAVGIAIGECGEAGQVTDFERGVKHGVSLANGTHP